MIVFILLFISLLLDGLLTNYLPYLVNDLSLLTPLFTVVVIFLIYPFYKKDLKKYYIIVFFLGIIYDLLYTNLWFVSATIFLSISFIVRDIYKNYEVTSINSIIFIILIIIYYESVFATSLFIFRVVPITLSKIIYKITHSLLLNIIYGEILFLIIKLLPKKYKRLRIHS